MQPIAFVDSNISLHGSFLGGLRIYSPNKLERIVKRNNVDEVLIAIPSASRRLVRNLLKDIEKLSVKVNFARAFGTSSRQGRGFRIEGGADF